MNEFAVWISETGPSVFIQNHSFSILPIIQSIHIIAIAIVVGSVLMLNLRILGVAGMDRTLGQTQRRFGPWQKWALVVLLLTGLIMLVGEPVRQLMSFSFWAKMVLILIGVSAAVAFKRSIDRSEATGSEAGEDAAPPKAMAVMTLVVWVMVIVFGRMIAYDGLWGVLSPSNHL